jgi:regulatory protein
MPLITALLPQPGRKESVAVYVDGQFVLSLAAALVQQAELRPGLNIPDNLLQALQDRQALHDGLQTAYRFLARGPKSEAEVRKRLKRQGSSEAAVDAVLAQLKLQRLIDDGAFAAGFAERRVATSPRSGGMVRWELRQRGVAKDVAEDAAAQLDDEALAYQAALKRAQRLPTMEYTAFRAKLGGFLQRRGFGYGLTSRVVARLWREQQGGDSGEA